MSLGDRIRGLAGGGMATGIGLAVSGAWLLLVLLFWLLGPEAEAAPGGLVRLASIVGVVLPLVLIWLAVGLAQAIASLRAEADDLHDQLAGMAGPGGLRAAPPRPAAGPATGPAGVRSEPARPAMPMPAPKPAAAPVPTPSRPAPPAADSRQTALRFEATESETVAMNDLIRALDFPDGPEDADGIAALRRALRDHEAARVLRSAQDVVTLLAQGDVYMDDMTPGATDLALWRRFGEGVRGAGVAGMAVVDDPDAIERVTAMIRGDEIFRDAAHHFLRHFDLALVRWLPRMSDEEILALAQTRSALAFMLLGRVTGLFG